MVIYEKGYFLLWGVAYIPDDEKVLELFNGLKRIRVKGTC